MGKGGLTRAKTMRIPYENNCILMPVQFGMIPLSVNLTYCEISQ